MNRLQFALLLMAAGLAMASVRGTNSEVHPAPAPLNGITSSECGPPSYKCSYDGIDPKPLCNNCDFPQVPDMSAEPNAVSYDKVFGITADGNQIVRCTYPDTNAAANYGYGIGFGGSGDTNAISKGGGHPFSYRLIIDDPGGSSYPFTYTPDPVHPKCEPTYPMGLFPVTEGSFSWLTPHLYYAFGRFHFKVNAIDLDSIGLPERKPIADFQQILPRTGPDWPGANQAVALGAIISPLTNNAGKYLYQATCSPGRTNCSSGPTGGMLPDFSQTVMTDTVDGAVIWRNIGIGFNGAATWYAVGGLSTDDDAFAKSFSDDGGQGGAGAVFAAVYKRSANVFYLFNVGTGIVSYFSCKDGTGHTCSGGSWVQTVLGMTSLSDRYVLHNLKLSKDGNWVLLDIDSCLFDTCSNVPGSWDVAWQLSATMATASKITIHPWGHWTSGFSMFVNQGDDGGINLYGRRFSTLGNPFPLNYVSSSSPNIEVHPSWNFNDGSDTTPICTATSGLEWPYSDPWENEVVCYGTNSNPDCSTAGHGVCQTTVKRFLHTYNPATCDSNDDFDGCEGIGALSPDGKYYAFTTNWGDTLGSTSKGGHGPSSCTGGFNFQKNHVYQVGDVFEPAHDTGDGHPNPRFNVYKVTVAGSSDSYPPHAWPQAWSLKQGEGRRGFYWDGGTILPLSFPNNPCNHRFQVTAGGGKPTGSAPPIWKDLYGYNGSCSSVTTGAKVTDGGITWTDMGEYVLGSMHLANTGKDDCRSDVFIGTLN